MAYRLVARWQRRRAFSGLIYILQSAQSKPSETLSVQLIGHLSRNDQADQLMAPLKALQKAGHVWLVSVNLSHENHETLRTSEAGLRRALQQRINYWRKKAGLDLFVFVLEQHAGRWHLHGVVAYPQDGRDPLRRALKGIAGKSESPVADRKLVHIQAVDDAMNFGSHFGLSGWALYIGKQLTQSTAALLGSPVMAPHRLKQLMNAKPARSLDEAPVPPEAVEVRGDGWGIF